MEYKHKISQDQPSIGKANRLGFTPLGSPTAVACDTGTAFSMRKQFLLQMAKQSAPMIMAIGIVTLFLENMAALDFSDIWLVVQAVSIIQWGLAAFATAISFWAVGRYDAVIHRHLHTQTCEKTASRAGIAAIAVSQTTGFGLITGALTRWRLLPDLSLLQASKISAAVAISFLGGLAVVLSIVALLLPMPFGFSDLGVWYLLPLLVLAPLCFIALVIASLMQPSISFRGHRVSWPSVTAIFAIAGLVAIDTLSAAGALYALLPPSIDLGFSQLYPAFLIAFAAALVSGTPGGVGPFEITLLMLLPFVPAEPLLAAILAYRAIYYAFPALLGAAVLARGPSTRPRPAAEMRLQTGGTSWFPSQLEALIHSAPRAEANLLRQGDKFLLHANDSKGCILAAIRGQAIIALGDPVSSTHPQNLLKAFKNTAEVQNRLPFLYKIGGRTAVQARRIGFVITPVSREAWLSPNAFDLSTPKHRRLRRKLRRAAKAGIRIKPLFNQTNLHHALAEMTRVAQDWSDTHGGERGFTMGTYDAAYVQSQRCFLAYQNDTLVGFVSFSTVATEWTLDLMRHSHNIPDGTMHALVTEAIKAAAAEKIPRLSLASVPWQPTDKSSPLAHWFWNRLGSASGGAGLTQFKSSFVPHWETLYMAAPNRIGLALGAFDVTRAIISRPATLRRPQPKNSQLEHLSQSL